MAYWRSMAKLVAELPLPERFHVVEFGDQMLVWGQHRPAKVLYKKLGCGRYESIDGNGRGTIVADLNLPLPDIGTFDLATSLGTHEHIFDQAQCWKTIHNLTKVGGYIVVIMPSQGYPGHGFYRMDECLFRDIAAANNYTLVRLDYMNASRGENIFVIYRRMTPAPFRVPQQGRYKSSLKPLSVAAC